MLDIARRNLFREKLRFIISCGGVALAITLILVLNGFFIGMERQVTAYLDNVPVDLIVAQKGLRNFTGTNSVIPISALSKVEKVEGVEKVVPVFVSYAVLETGGRKIFTLLIGFDPQKDGGPWKMSKGSSDIKDDEVIFDRTAANKNHLKIGNKINILGKEFKIVGLSGGTSSWMTGTAFITFKAAAELRNTEGTAGFLLVSARNPAEVDILKNNISKEIPGLSVVTKETMAENDVALFASVFSGPLRFMVVVAFLIGLMLVGLTVYTATVEKSREFGILKAIGVKNLRLYLIVFRQALILSVTGSIAGIAISFVLIRILSHTDPQFLILIELRHIAQILPAGVLMGILASYVPVRVIARIDPAIALKKGALT